MNEIFIILLLIFINGLFAMAEIALVSARKSSLKAEANRGSRAARKALALQDDPDNFLSSVQIGITLVGLLTGMFSGNKIAVIFADWLGQMGIESRFASGIAQTLIIIIVTYLTIVLGELVPKRIGMNSAERVAKMVAGPMTIIAKLTKPIVWTLAKSTSAIVGAFGMSRHASRITEEEIKSMVQEGADEGEVLPMEQDIVGRVFTLGDLTISSIMTLRSDIVWLEKEMTEAEVRECIEQHLYEEYPVADNDLDHVIGILRLKDFFINSCKPNFCLEDLLVKPTYVHENMNVYKVLEDMKAKKVSRALVCDEFGSCCGIITHKDILEALIGDMNDDDFTEQPDIVARAEGDGWLVDGQCMIYDFLSHFGIEAGMQDYEYTTVAGLLLDTLGRVPEGGECITWGDFKFEIVDMDGPRIDKVIVKREE